MNLGRFQEGSTVRYSAAEMARRNVLWAQREGEAPACCVLDASDGTLLASATASATSSARSRTRPRWISDNPHAIAEHNNTITQRSPLRRSDAIRGG